jgi:putative endopeptidase
MRAMSSIRPIDPAEFDSAIRPTDDFFGYVNNTWIAKNPIPANESRWGSFNVLRVQVEEQVKEIFGELAVAKDDALDDTAKKVRDFYKTGMDVERLNGMGDKSLSKLLDAVDKIDTIADLVRVSGFLHRRGINVWWSPSSEPDAKRSEIMALYLAQGGLSLPDRDYYLNTDEKSAAIRKGYFDYAVGVLGGSSISADAENLASVVQCEKTLAENSMTRVELRDVEKQYNKMLLPELSKVTPSIDWNIYFQEIGIPSPEYVIVCQPKFMETINHLFETTPLAILKSYMRWHVLNGMANFLSENFERQAFDFYGRTFGGATEMKPRWRRVQSVVNGMLDEAVAKLYVARHFSESAKARITKLVDHLTAAYRTRIQNLSWMGEETKQKAFVKLDAVTRKLGYPDAWKDISGLEIDADSYAENYARAYAFEFDRQMKKIGKPVDRTEWYMSPQTVNACYHPLMNEILFPAAILQPPFFYPEGDDDVNFGGIGTVIGHELTHGFDDQGALFDAKGNLANWWTKEDKERFDKSAEQLSAQFDAYEPLPGLHVNGKLTLGENIADLGGILVAYDGLVLALKDRPAKPIDGLTPLQRFFVSYTITERSASREEALRLQVQVDPHSPSPYRVNGPFSNMDEFYDAFDSKKGDKLWRDPDDRVKIW